MNKYDNMPLKVLDIKKTRIYVKRCYRCLRLFKTTTHSNKAVCRECCKDEVAKQESRQIGDYLE